MRVLAATFALIAAVAAGCGGTRERAVAPVEPTRLIEGAGQDCLGRAPLVLPPELADAPVGELLVIPEEKQQLGHGPGAGADTDAVAVGQRLVGRAVPIPEALWPPAQSALLPDGTGAWLSWTDSPCGRFDLGVDAPQATIDRASLEGNVRASQPTSGCEVCGKLERVRLFQFDGALVLFAGRFDGRGWYESVRLTWFENALVVTVFADPPNMQGVADVFAVARDLIARGTPTTAASGTSIVAEPG